MLKVLLFIVVNGMTSTTQVVEFNDMESCMVAAKLADDLPRTRATCMESVVGYGNRLPKIDAKK